MPQAFCWSPSPSEIFSILPKLDELCAQLVPSEEGEPGQQCEQRDVVILRSMPGLGRTILAVRAPLCLQ
jgi:hypothetical protein